MRTITVTRRGAQEVIDLTGDVDALAASMADGVCQLFTHHTTCALTIPTDEAGIAEDFLTVLPADHVREFQRVVRVELEGPRARTITVDGTR